LDIAAPEMTVQATWLRVKADEKKALKTKVFFGGFHTKTMVRFFR
jgi:hypothetical protein